jgi:hypothetical protein
MTAKKKVKRNKMATKGRPKGKNPSYVEMGLRGTAQECELIQRGTVAEAARLHVVVSRNNFCLRAALAAAKRELGISDMDESSED